jgi:hypothetical protein
MTPGLEPDDDEAFHRRSWRVQRAGWITMLAIVLAGLVGLLGRGPLSRAVTEHPSGVRVEHNRFVRVDAPETLQVHVPPPARPGDGYRPAVGRTFLDRVQIDSVIPRPLVTEAFADRVVYVFAGGGRPVATFHFTPRSFGILRAEITAAGAGPAAFWLLAYP